MGCITDPINAFKEMLGDNPHFQAWAGVANASQAKARIYRDGLPPPDVAVDAFSAAAYNAFRPYALIYPAEDEPLILQRDAAHNCWKHTGAIICVLSKSYNATSTPDAQFAQMAADVENIIASGDINNPGLTDLSARMAGYFLTDVRVDFVGRNSPRTRQRLRRRLRRVDFRSLGVTNASQQNRNQGTRRHTSRHGPRVQQGRQKIVPCRDFVFPPNLPRETFHRRPCPSRRLQATKRGGHSLRTKEFWRSYTGRKMRSSNTVRRSSTPAKPNAEREP